MFHRPHGKCQVLLVATFSRRVSCPLEGIRYAHSPGIVRALWTVFNCVCYIAACATNRARISPVNQTSRFLHVYMKEKKKSNHVGKLFSVKAEQSYL